MHSHLLDSLTPPQREAVEHREGALLILAGPGSGKTRVITHRIAQLLHHGVPARQILALTFTNKAADEMRLRVERLAPGEPVWTSTFHRFCSRLLRQHAALVGLGENFTIYDTSDSRQLLRRVLAEAGVDPAHYTPDRIAHALSWAKNNLISPAEYTPRSGHPLGHIIQKVYPLYAERLLRANAVDFDDLLLHVAMLLRNSPETRSTLDARYRYILVDEYQDTNLAQYSIVRALSIDHPNLAVTGDPDQSIYGWRGANLKNILDFEQDFSEVRVVKLERNYRSTKAILRAADALIVHNRRRKQKALYTENAEGAPVSLIAYVNGQDEADLIAERIADDIRAGKRRPRDFAIFYRVNALSRSLEFALRQHGIPYQMVNGLEFYQRKEIKDVLAYLRSSVNPDDEVSLERIANVPTRGISDTTIKFLQAFAVEQGISLWGAMKRAGEVGALAPRAIASVGAFVQLMEFFGAQVASCSARTAMELVLQKSGLEAAMKKLDPTQENEIPNVNELVSSAAEYDREHPEGTLAEYLAAVSLVSDADRVEGAGGAVTLMTLHAAKGLEFPVVSIIGLEEGCLPHSRAREDERELEEERRLCFVGITRAQERLILSNAAWRTMRGKREPTVSSPFLHEMPRDLMEVTDRTDQYERTQEEYRQPWGPRSPGRWAARGGSRGRF